MNDLNSRPNTATAIRGVLLVIVAVGIGISHQRNMLFDGASKHVWNLSVERYV